MLDRFVDGLAGFDHVIVILLPYTRIPPEVEMVVSALAELGASVVRPQPNNPPWPARPKNFDHTFQAELCRAIVATVSPRFPRDTPLVAEEETVAFDILRGLASHSKMGPNNHSSEDDLWKSRGQGLRSGERKRILKDLLACNILGCKPNRSMGGTGMVYWIKDVKAARSRFPGLAQHLDQGRELPAEEQ